MPNILRFIISAALLSLSSHALANTDAAEAAALAWLEAIDNGNFEQAWEAASPILKAPLSQGMLARTIELVRRDFGKVSSRQRMRASRETSMPGAPSGDYIVFTFQTGFENNERRVETVTPHLEDGTWRVSGYYVE
ncbi:MULTISPECIES: DUF4019 domain-containing protein [unclassified Halomonas]|uniref:DUF4019 domain-containing protein n=1 Tax=unclassified Halomonas TaxID=2609666 RepID=UPI0006DB2D48|nr:MULTISPECIES: DUF4019 domain-containing protein [unclassified Halomonas]KPQ22232.1 MAG: Protein of unknown function (DUF4019) [Halomonas sp. HL-93]SBR48162.1 Protein of unknown function (DUF4019) [Halomonas sp. HL-93]SNY95778.1 Protein of unknown function [Halomonas sp. hl-4]